jgi:hypothetical protein
MVDGVALQQIFLQVSLISPCSSSFHHCSVLLYDCLLRSVLALTRHHIFISLVCVAWDVGGYRVRQYVMAFLIPVLCNHKISSLSSRGCVLAQCMVLEDSFFFSCSSSHFLHRVLSDRSVSAASVNSGQLTYWPTSYIFPCVETVISLGLNQTNH